MDITDAQWELIAPHIPDKRRRDRKGRPRQPDRAVLDGILWVLRTGAPWKDLPERYPPYQTVHRRFREWVTEGVLTKLLQALAEDMLARGKLDVSECFIDGSFSGAKKGASVWVRPSVARGPRSWLWQTAMVFRSPSTWSLLLRTKSPWWMQRLPEDLPERVRTYSLVTGHTTVMRSMRG